MCFLTGLHSYVMVCKLGWHAVWEVSSRMKLAWLRPSCQIMILPWVRGWAWGQIHGAASLGLQSGWIFHRFFEIIKPSNLICLFVHQLQKLPSQRPLLNINPATKWEGAHKATSQQPRQRHSSSFKAHVMLGATQNPTNQLRKQTDSYSQELWID